MKPPRADKSLDCQDVDGVSSKSPRAYVYSEGAGGYPKAWKAPTLRFTAVDGLVFHRAPYRSHFIAPMGDNYSVKVYNICWEKFYYTRRGVEGEESEAETCVS